MFENWFGPSAMTSASNAAWAEQPTGWNGPLSMDQLKAGAAGAGVDPAALTTDTTLGLTDKQWKDAAGALGGAGKALGGGGAAQPAAAAARPAGAGIHAGNPAAFAALVQQVMAQRAALGQRGGAAPAGLLGAGHGG